MLRIWAPWRYKFFDKPKMQGCFVCNAVAASSEHDRENLLLIRDSRTLLMLNRYPYTVGALMAAPNQHLATINDLDEETMLQLMTVVKRAMQVLDVALKPQGYNIGINQGIAAGAGIADHLHVHVVPRWNADVNFMTSIGETRVLAEEPEHMYDKLKVAME